MLIKKGLLLGGLIFGAFASNASQLKIMSFDNENQKNNIQMNVVYYGESQQGTCSLLITNNYTGESWIESFPADSPGECQQKAKARQDLLNKLFDDIYA